MEVAEKLELRTTKLGLWAKTMKDHAMAAQRTIVEKSRENETLQESYDELQNDVHLLKADFTQLQEEKGDVKQLQEENDSLRQDVSRLQQAASTFSLEQAAFVDKFAKEKATIFALPHCHI